MYLSQDPDGLVAVRRPRDDLVAPGDRSYYVRESSLHVTKPTSVNMMAIITSSQGSPRRLLHTNANPCDGRCATEIDVLSPLWLRSDGRPEAPDNPQNCTWFKVPLEKTKSGLGAEQFRGVIKYHEGTRTVEFDLSRPLFLD